MGDFDGAMAVFYEHYRPFVEAFAFRRVDRDSVDDVVAEVFAVAWRRVDDVPDDALPWLYATARKAIGTWFRTRDRTAALRDKIASVPAEPPGDPADAALRRLRFADALAALNDDDRDLLLLVAWEGLSPADIGTVFGITPGAASVRLHRARRRLLDALQRDNETSHD